jgi:hypothetical protein
MCQDRRQRVERAVIPDVSVSAFRKATIARFC